MTEPFRSRSFVAVAPEDRPVRSRRAVRVVVDPECVHAGQVLQCPLDALLCIQWNERGIEFGQIVCGERCRVKCACRHGNGGEMWGELGVHGDTWGTTRT